MPSVVVGVDNGSASTRAIEFALKFVPSDVEIVIVHVINWSPYSFNTPTENEERPRRRELELEAAQEQVVKPMTDLVTAGGRTPTSVVRHGSPSETLLDIAHEHSAAHVIVGRTGDSGLRETLFGSVAQRLVQNSRVPVTVVP
ncbi:MAG: universal stress protein [Actinomycetales bacterium]